MRTEVSSIARSHRALAARPPPQLLLAVPSVHSGRPSTLRQAAAARNVLWSRQPDADDAQLEAEEQVRREQRQQAAYAYHEAGVVAWRKQVDQLHQQLLNQQKHRAALRSRLQQDAQRAKQEQLRRIAPVAKARARAQGLASLGLDPQIMALSEKFEQMGSLVDEVQQHMEARYGLLDTPSAVPATPSAQQQLQPYRQQQRQQRQQQELQRMLISPQQRTGPVAAASYAAAGNAAVGAARQLAASNGGRAVAGSMSSSQHQGQQPVFQAKQPQQQQEDDERQQQPWQHQQQLWQQDQRQQQQPYPWQQQQPFPSPHWSHQQLQTRRQWLQVAQQRQQPQPFQQQQQLPPWQPQQQHTHQLQQWQPPQ
eukprot:GHRR01006104.1.p1 GENE.GHRR01006104.1~~GHRR01006104.1.p1  ORF type:complete len:367 (+),score=185.10 GHRR01006104.1:1796-2896(+)